MREKKIHLDDKDALIEVIAKLDTVSDFMHLFGNDNFSMNTRTPEGLSIIIGECIGTLKTIGGVHE